MSRRPLWIPAFIAALEERKGIISEAAAFAGVPRSVVYERQRTDRYFQAEIAGARERIAQARAEIARRNARTA